MIKISKKQRAALRQIDELQAKRKREIILGVGSIVLMVLLIGVYNLVTYQMGIVTDADTFLRAGLYAVAMVVAGFCGIMLMKASQKQRKIDGFRQSVGISRETMEAWKKGEIEK